jgi:hypothetical protein
MYFLALICYNICMSLIKEVKDQLAKTFWYGKSVPQELFELSQYFRNNGPINFDFKTEEGEIIAISKDFRQGSIVTSAKSKDELDAKIIDAILTSFDVPSSYKKEAGLHKVGQQKETYAIA